MIDMLPKRINKFALIALAVWSGCALANPSGPTLVNGTATFSQPNANTLNVTNSRNAIINWQSFNIGQGQTTNFIQPSSASAVMNRVISNNPSQIYGNLNSNGKVFLINQHGLMIGAGARINTAGFYGSTLNITNEDFLKGNLKFEGGGFGGIVNQGYIHAGPNGNVVLVAPNIENGGVIEVDNGNVILAAGESIRITSLNDASIEFDVQSPDNGIINLGDIIAKQGAARLFAGNLKHSGSINATGLVQNADGSISLVAQADIEVTAGASVTANGEVGGKIQIQSHHGDVYFSGDVSARGESGQGGRIEVLGDRVALLNQASVDASGQTGGGEVLVGGDYQGRNPDMKNASATVISADTSIRADAASNGDGGKVIVWADDVTKFHGSISARGGNESGDGGFVETSGKVYLEATGSVDAGSTNGKGGEWLLDPRDVFLQTLTATGGDDSTGGSFDSGIPNTFTPSADNAIADIDQIVASLEGGTSVTITTFDAVGAQFGDITVVDPIIVALNSGDVLLTLDAENDIFVDSAISASGANALELDFNAGRSILINADIITNNGLLSITANDSTKAAPQGGPSFITMASLTKLDAGTGNIELSMDFGSNGDQALGDDITIENLTANHIVIRHKAADPGGDILQIAGVITASSLFIDHDGPTNGSVGSPDPPLNVVADFIGAHIHEPTLLGIYINAQPLGAPAVTVGNTCYGNGDPGCTTFGPHLVGGLETINGGGSINLGVTGNLLAVEPIQIDDVLGTGNAGNISLTASGEIIANSDIRNFIITGNISFNSASGAVSLFNGANVGINGGTISLNGGTGNLLLNARSFLEGVGIVAGDVISTGGLIDIGDDSGNVGALTITGDLVLDTNSILVFDIVGSAAAGIDYDLLNVNGTNGVFLAGDLVALWDTQAPPGPATYTLINAANGFTSVFDNVFGPVGTTITSVVNPTTFQLSTTTVSNNIIFWGNAAGGDWAIPGNWVGGVVPGTSDFVDINVDNPVTITISTAVPDILGIETQNELTFTGAGQLTINNTNPSLIGDTLTLGSSGGLSVNGEMYMAGQMIWNAGSLAGAGNITIASIGSLDLSNPDSSIDVKLTNTGTITKFDAGVTTLTGTLDNFGTLLLNNGELAYVGALNLNEGVIDIGVGASLTTGNGDLNNIPGATIRGSGTLDVGTGTLLNDGTLQPGGVGTTGILTIQGNLSMGSTANLQIEVNDTGLVAGANYDQLVVAGASSTATLDGFLSVSLLNGSPVAGTYRLIDLPDGGTLANGFGIDNLAAAGFGPLSVSLNFADAIFGSGGVSWDDGGAVGDWFDPLNWSADLVPTSADDVTINGADLIINIAGAADANTLSLASGYTLNINSGSLTIATNAQFDGDLGISGGTLAGNGAITVNGNFNWTGGLITGAGLLTTNAVSTLNQPGGLTLSRNWSNAGTVNWQAGNVLINSGRTFTNTSIFNANAGAIFTVSSGAETFNNQGALNVNSDTAFQGGGSLDNSGSFVIASATTLSISTGSSVDTGTWTVGDGAIDITGGFRFLSDGFSATSSSGSLTLSGGTLNVNTTAPLTLPAALTLNVTGGVLTGNGDLAVDGAFNWTGGTFIGAGSLTTNALSTLNQPGGLTLSRDWTNAGTVNWLAGNVLINSGRTFTSTAIFNANAGATFSVNSGAETFDNQGALSVNSDTTFQGGGSLDNSGSFVIASATTLSIETGVSSDAGTWTIGDGAINISGGSRTLNDGFSATATTGSLNVTGGTLDVNTSSPLVLPGALAVNVSSGSLTGNGALVVNGPFGWTGGSIQWRKDFYQ